MTADLISSLTQQALVLVMWISLPVVLVAAFVGLAWGVFQALTQINDQTTSFALKLLALVVVISIGAGWAGAQLRTFGETVFGSLPQVKR